MNKKELVKKISENLNVSQKEGSNILDAVLESFEEGLTKGSKRVSIVGWGNLQTVTRSAREGRNPQTGEIIKIAAKNVVRFKSGSSLEDKINSVKSNSVKSNSVKSNSVKNKKA